MRLIDADAIKYTEYINGDITVSKKEIERQQKAYDTGKVVEELEKLKNEKTMGSHKAMIKEAIEIVKQGGVSKDDDVCEYKKHRIIDNVQMHKTSCMHEIEERLVRKYVHCPYCGKKIKVVE